MTADGFLVVGFRIVIRKNSEVVKSCHVLLISYMDLKYKLVLQRKDYLGKFS